MLPPVVLWWRLMPWHCMKSSSRPQWGRPHGMLLVVLWPAGHECCHLNSIRQSQALQPTGKPSPQWLPRGLQPPYITVPFLNPPPVHWW